MSKTTYILGFCLFAVLSLGSCGGSSGSTASDSPPMTKQQFINKGNALCQERRLERIRGFKEAEPEGSELAEIIVEVSLPPYREMVEELGGLNPPQGDNQEVQRMLASMETAADSVERDIAKATPAIKAANEAVRAYGLRECKF